MVLAALGRVLVHKMHKTSEELMTVKEVADFLKVSLRTAHKFIHNKNFDGLLYIGRSVRISKNKLLEYIDRNLEFRA